MPKLKKLCDGTAAVEHCWQVYCRLKFYFIFLCGISNAAKPATVPVQLLLHWGQFVVSILSTSGNTMVVRDVSVNMALI